MILKSYFKGSFNFIFPAIKKVTQILEAERNLIYSLMTLTSSSDSENKEKEKSEYRLIRLVNSHPYLGKTFISVAEQDIKKKGGRSLLHNRLYCRVDAGTQREAQMKRQSQVQASDAIELARYGNQ